MTYAYEEIRRNSFIQQLCISIYLLPNTECARTKDSYKRRKGEGALRGEQKGEKESLSPWRADKARRQTWEMARQYQNLHQKQSCPTLAAGRLWSVAHKPFHLRSYPRDRNPMSSHRKSAQTGPELQMEFFTYEKIIWGICMSLKITLRQI